MTVEDKIELERAQYGNARVNHLFELGLEFENLRMTATELWDDDLTEVIEDLFSGELEMHKRESLIIEHNQKLPANVAKWLEFCKTHGYSLKLALEYPTPDAKEYWQEAKEWILENENSFAKAWIDDKYEVEEEPKWDIPILSLATSDGKQQFLTYDEEKNTYFASRKQDGLKQEYTKDELRHVPNHFKHYAIPVDKEVSE